MWQEAAAEIQRRASGQQASSSRSNDNDSGEGATQWFNIGGGRLLARYPHLLCEYDSELRSPVGAVFINMGARRLCQFTSWKACKLPVAAA